MEDALVVNATPAGAGGADVDAFAGATLEDLTVLDAPYRDGDVPTGLVGQARSQGAGEVVDGRALLRAQARDQALLFGADGAGVPDLDRVLDLALVRPPSLILLGTRGAGKSGVGRAVARRLGRPFLDLDEEVERITGRTPAAWIEGEGWDAFRAVEARALERALHRTGIVLATGGGVVEQAANRTRLAAAGFRLHLAVRPEVAAERVRACSVARPRIPGAADALEEARLLIERRSRFWSELAHAEVDANRSLDEVAASVVRRWCEHARRS